MNSIHTSSLTHEIVSYGCINDLKQFILNRYHELVQNGVWINRDVVGPDNKDDIIYMRLNQQDGRNHNYDKQITDIDELKSYLDGLSTYAKFLRFATDFRLKEGYKINYEINKMDYMDYIKLKLTDACEFMTKKDYTGNWHSEMHETFCFWNFEEWQIALEEIGFKVSMDSHAYANQWIVDNRLKGKVELLSLKEDKLEKLDFPVTHLLTISEKWT